MFSPANATHFSFAIQGLSHGPRVLNFTRHEALSQPYYCHIERLSSNPALGLSALNNQPAFIATDARGMGVRGLTIAIASLEPAGLTLSKRLSSFNGMPVTALEGVA